MIYNTLLSCNENLFAIIQEFVAKKTLEHHKALALEDLNKSVATKKEKRIDVNQLLRKKEIN